MHQLVKQLAVIGMLAVGAALSAGAYVITPDAGGQFDLTVSGSALTSWAVANGGSTAGPGTFATFADGNGMYMSGSENSDQQCSLTIPFSSATSFASAVLYVGSSAQTYPDHSNQGQCLIYAKVGNGAETLIFQQDSPDRSNPVYYNYNGTTPAAGWYNGSVDLSALVAGATDFSVRFYSARGWSGWAYNGGVFYTGYTEPQTQSDFRLAGSEAIPEPATAALLGLAGLALLRRRRG
jgi:hypothetical protein